ncbi:Uncharacterised protein [Vibrio mimicus]|nr:hypothetical protein D908_11949 [Vibrio mimicus CAIM 602]SUQ23229.1 Uncharacterised protein [Vibrio mimicus]
MLHPAKDHEIIQCIENASKFFNLNLDDNYTHILKLTDGISCKGFNIYSDKQREDSSYFDEIIEINLEFFPQKILRL